MKKIIALLLVTVLAISLFTGCSVSAVDENDRQMKYAKAITALGEFELQYDGVCTDVSDALTEALKYEKFETPNNIIMMIGDGMGFNTVKSSQLARYGSLHDNKLAMQHLPYHGASTTYSLSGVVTDSAAGGSALSTGYKLNNGAVAYDTDNDKDIKTLFELAAEKGKKTGFVVTKSVADATPASYTAHVPERGMYYDISRQQLEMMMKGDLDVIMGGGIDHYEHADVYPTLERAKKSGITYEKVWSKLKNVQTPYIGLFSPMALDTTSSRIPTLAEMTDKALKTLENENGFFLMVEGSLIDIASHSNDFDWMLHEMKQFDDAVTVCLSYVARHPDTVILITADHETGGITIPDGTDSTDFNKIYYTTGGHTGKDVPVYSIGKGMDVFGRTVNNTYIGQGLGALLGDPAFGDPDDDFLFLDGLFNKLRSSSYKLKNPYLSFEDEFETMQGVCFDSVSAIHYDKHGTDERKELLSVEAQTDKDYIMRIINVHGESFEGFKNYLLEVVVPHGEKVSAFSRPLTPFESTEKYDYYKETLIYGKDFNSDIFEVTFGEGKTAQTVRRFFELTYVNLENLVDFTSEASRKAIEGKNKTLFESGNIKFNPNSLFFEIAEGDPVFSIPSAAFIGKRTDFSGYNRIIVTYKNLKPDGLKTPPVTIVTQRSRFPLDGSVAEVASFGLEDCSYEFNTDQMGTNAKKVSSLAFQLLPSKFEITGIYLAKAYN